MQLVVFDIDGTLLLSGPVVNERFLASFEEACGHAPRYDGFSFAGMTDRAIFRRMLQGGGREHEYEMLFARFAELFPRRLAEVYDDVDGPHLLPGVAELIEILHGRDDVMLAVGTGNLRGSAYVKLGRFGLDRVFPVGGFGGDHEDRADLFAQAIEEAHRHYGVARDGLRPWVVGDTLEDVRAAKAVGARILLVRTGWLERGGEAGADAVLDELRPTERVLDILLDDDGRGPAGV